MKQLWLKVRAMYKHAGINVRIIHHEIVSCHIAQKEREKDQNTHDNKHMNNKTNSRCMHMKKSKGV